MVAINLNFAYAVNKSELIRIINLAVQKQQSAYTPNSWTPFAVALNEAIIVRDTSIVTQEQIDYATQKLLNAMNALAGLADKSGLLAAIQAAQRIIPNRNIYTLPSYTLFENSYRSAVGTYDNPNAPQAHVDAATIDLWNRINGLVQKPMPSDWNSLKKEAYLISKLFWTSGTSSQQVNRLRSSEYVPFPTYPFDYVYCGNSLGGQDVKYEAKKTVVRVTFPEQFSRCIIKCTRANDFPSTGGSPIGRVGMARMGVDMYSIINGPVGMYKYEDTQIVRNFVDWTFNSPTGEFEIDYSQYSEQVKGQTDWLIFDVLDNNAAMRNEGGGYKLNSVNIYFE